MTWRESAENIVILDNGAHFLKAQLASAKEPSHILHAAGGPKGGSSSLVGN